MEMHVDLKQWLVYTFDSLASFEIVLINFPNWFVPTGEFLYHGVSSSVGVLGFGVWKNASQLSFNLETYFSKYATGQPTVPVAYILPLSTLELVLSSLTFFVSSSTSRA